MNTTHAFSWVEGCAWNHWIYNGSFVFWWAVFFYGMVQMVYIKVWPDNMESLQWYYEHQTLCHLMIMLWWYHAVILKGAGSFKGHIIISVELSHTAGISYYITELHHSFQILRSVALILQVYCLKSVSIFSILNHCFFLLWLIIISLCWCFLS